MPRSKFATKAYGPTKPAICEDQQLPPGTLSPGPGKHNAAYFFLILAGTGGFTFPVAGSTVLTRAGTSDRYEGTANVGDYTVAIVLTAFAPVFWPKFDWTIKRNGTFINASSITADAPRSIDPYDTGILTIGAQGPGGQQMIRAVATD